MIQTSRHSLSHTALAAVDRLNLNPLPEAPDQAEVAKSLSIPGFNR